MSRPASNRFYLADLVMAALMCGLVLGLFTSVRSPADASLIFLLIVVVTVTWSLFRARRQAPTCEECGQRFIQPKTPVVLACCPHCGLEQLAWKRSIGRVKRVSRGLLSLLASLVLLAAVLLTGFTGGPHDEIAWGAGLFAVGCVILILIAILDGLHDASRLNRKERPCEACGGIIAAKPPDGPMICPQCRIRHLRPEEAKRERVGNLRTLLWTFAILATLLAILATFAFPRFVSSIPGMSFWIGLPLLVLALMATLFGALVALVLSIQLVRRRRLRSERGTLAMARGAAGRDGEVVEEGPWTIWYSGPDDPVPMLRDQIGAACRRFGALTGDEAVAGPRLRILVFHDRGAFLTFHRRIVGGIDFTSFDGLHLGAPYSLMTLCTAPPPCRVPDPARTMRSLAVYALLESAWGPRPPAWLQTGLARSAAGTDRDGLARLNRRMVAALGRGTVWSVEMFSMTLKDMTRLLRGPKDPRNLQKVMEFHFQSWSIVEYLCGERAPRDLRPALGAFLRDARSKADQEGSFRLHFGLGFGPLLDDWRQWVLDRGIGAYEPPPDRIRDGLLERVLPAIRDSRAKRGDRLAAIGEWVNAGFVLGADALIDLLREPGDLPKEHIIWALCMVSGNAWGDEPDRWQAWWDDLPSAWEEPPEPATERPFDGLAIGLGAGAPADTTADAPGDRSPREEETRDALPGDIPTGDIGLIRRP